MSYELEMIQGSIMDRQRELHGVADVLAKEANKLSKRSSLAKVLLVFLGALATTQGAMTQLIGESSAGELASIVIYTVIGLLIATIAGLEAAFKLESRSAELTVLAANCHSTIRTVDSQWQKEIGTVENEQKLPAARRLLDTQDSVLSEIQTLAAKAGVNITLEIRELRDVQEMYAA